MGVILVIGLAYGLSVVVYDGNVPARYVMADNLTVYLVNSTVSVWVDVGRVANVTLVYCSGVLSFVGDRGWLNFTPAGLSMVWVYVDGALATSFAVKPSLITHNPYMTDLSLALPQFALPGWRVVANLSWYRHAYCPADFVKLLARDSQGRVYELARGRWPYWELVSRGVERKSLSFVVNLPPGVYEVKAVGASCHGRYNYFNPDWSDVCADGGFAGRRPEELSWDVYEAASAPVRLVVGGLEHLLAWAAVHGLNARETTQLLKAFGFGVEVKGVDRRGGSVSFALSNGSVVAVPVFFEVQSNGTGLFVVGNPSFVNVTYIARAKFSKTGRELNFTLSVGAWDAALAAPAVWREEEAQYDVSLFLYIPAGAYSLGNFSVSFDKPRLVSGNRSVLLRPLHAVFLPPETKRLVDAYKPCNEAFWRGFDEVSDPYDYSLLGDVALTIIPVGRIVGFFGKLLGAGARAFEEINGLINAIKSAYYALSSSKWARAVGTASGFVIPDVFIAEDLRQLLEPQAAEEVFSAFGVDFAEVERFHAGVLTDSSCFHAGRYYAAVYVSWAQRVSAVVDLASNLYAKVSKDALDKFGRSFVKMAEKGGLFKYKSHLGYVAARAWGPYGVDENEWAKAYDELARALTGRSDVAAVVASVRVGVVEEDGTLRMMLLSKRAVKGVFKFESEVTVTKKVNVGGIDIFYEEGGEEGGGFIAAIYSSQKVVRWTSPEFFKELQDRSLITVSESKFKKGNVKGIKYLCFSYSVVYDSALYGALSSLVGDVSQWRQRFAFIPLFSVLNSMQKNIRVKHAAYEVDMAPQSEAVRKLDYPVAMAGVVGYLENTGKTLRDTHGVFVELRGVRAGGAAPDGLALAQWDGWRIVWAEVDRDVGSLTKSFREKVVKLQSAGILAGGSFTQYGVALAAFRVDVLSGVTVGGNALGGSPVSERVLAYPQAKSGLVDWAKAMKRHDVAPLLAVYEGDGPKFKVRGVLFKQFVDIDNADIRAVLDECLGKK